MSSSGKTDAAALYHAKGAQAVVHAIDRAQPMVPLNRPMKPMTPRSKSRRGDADDRSMATRVVDLVLDCGDVTLLADEQGGAYARIQESDHARLHPLDSGDFGNWVADRVYRKEGCVPSSEALAAAKRIFAARANQERATLFNRIARGADGAIWIDMADPKWRAIRVDAKGWQIVAVPPPLFRRYSHMKPLPDPVRGGSFKRVLDFLNLASEHDRILFLCSTVTTLIPDIPQLILMIHGTQGSAKTTAARIRRGIIDPSSVPTVIVKRDDAELVQALNNHYMPIFDNLTRFASWQSDILCQAATGGGLTKRKLYTDQDDVVFQFKRPVVLTGINLPSVAPDLLDRAVLIRLDRIAPEQRLEEVELWERYNDAAPEIIGGLLDILVAAMRKHPEIKLERLPRMADCARWGAAASIALDYGIDAFVDALGSNTRRQVEQITEGDPVVAAIVSLAKEKGDWQGSATELLEELKRHKESEEDWPKGSSALGRKLNTLVPILMDMNVHAQQQREANIGRQRKWHLKWTGEDHA